MSFSLEQIQKELALIEQKMLQEEHQKADLLLQLHPNHFHSARNFIHYLVLRSEDIRGLQDLLHINGLSSLASSESHIHRQLQAIRQILSHKYKLEELDSCTYSFSMDSLEEKSNFLFGTKSEPEIPSIMVTFDSGFAGNYSLIKSLLQNGMNVARINCAHDDEATWSKMINKLKKASRVSGISCKIYMDLAGPKIRTIILGKGKDKRKVKIKEGQLIWLAESMAGFEKDEIVISPNERGILSMLKVGERVFIDDGLIRAVVEKVKKDAVGIRITRDSSKSGRIKSEKGINFPDSEIDIPALTAYDRECLPFICANADLVGFSFVRNPRDMEELRSLIYEISEEAPAIILKIETPDAVKNLPMLLMEGMKMKGFGVMIARGDLAVEIGFERLGEIQEEILWICEAAHVPVIWATQVLESLNKSGMASRSEITDAGHAAHADCVMLNKGEHTIEVIETLKDILHRSVTHRKKKRFTFRKLKIAERFFQLIEKEKGS
ncbi:MAG: pyruvate kinase [Algoriphagus sp.]|nr:pyruvate kinase [Algoriphagus sp.]